MSQAPPVDRRNRTTLHGMDPDGDEHREIRPDGMQKDYIVLADDIRPKTTVEVQCSHPECGWSFWIDALDPRLPDGPFFCGEHDKDLAAKLRDRIAKMSDAEVVRLWDRLKAL